MSVVVAAMSGGVDSSVVAGLLLEQGHEVIGVHMKLHNAEGESGHCCGLDDALDARAVADRLGIPFHVIDLQEAFREAVMEEFIRSYVAGRTPNPCVRCNGVLKFKILLARSVALGADMLATGHYARIGPGPSLMKAVDHKKDQSYFLFPMDKRALEKPMFPLGGMSKQEVRGIAERMGLLTASKPDSQDICFVPDDDHAGLISRARSGLDGSGEIVDLDGNVLGKHDAYWRFTVGQRRGIGVAMGVPVYVTKVDPNNRRVTIATRDQLDHVGLRASEWTWNNRPNPSKIVGARIRHNGGVIPCRVGEGEDHIEVNFLEPVWAVAPGQGVVIYDGDTVLGGGWVDNSISKSSLVGEVS